MNEEKGINNNTVYISNLPFSLTNNDLYKIFEKHGKIIKVTIVKEPVIRTSKGIAFIKFLQNTDAEKCVAATNNTQMFGRTLKSSVAKDNGRSSEFMKKRKYSEQPRCYECGEFGHLSYKCKLNVLGERERPVVKKLPHQTRVKKLKNTFNSEDDNSNEEIINNADDDEDDDKMHQPADQTEIIQPKKLRYKKNTYFSDDEEITED